MKIAVLCSGGDAPGMNAAVATVFSTAQGAGCECVGIRDGLVGLAAAQAVPLETVDFNLLARQGGCFLGTSRLPVGMSREELLMAALEGCRSLQLEGLVVLGGNGSLSGLAQLVEHIPCAGIPATIDNDLAGSSASIGWHTAVQHGLVALDCICDTASALSDRIFTLETLGGGTGHLALAVAYAGRADAVLVPEVEETSDRIVERVRLSLRTKHHAIVVDSEGSPWARKVAEVLETATGVRVRGTVLGHSQRGGSPLAPDRILARRLGAAAVDLVCKGESGAVIWNGDGVGYSDLTSAAAPKPLDLGLYQSVWTDF